MIALASPCSIDLGLLRPLFLLADFFVRICRAKALLALIFPVPVFLNRFAAPRLVFIFGTIFSPQKQNFPSPRFRVVTTGGRGSPLLDKTPVGLQGSIENLSNHSHPRPPPCLPVGRHQGGGKDRSRLVLNSGVEPGS